MRERDNNHISYNILYCVVHITHKDVNRSYNKCTQSTWPHLHVHNCHLPPYLLYPQPKQNKMMNLQVEVVVASGTVLVASGCAVD